MWAACACKNRPGRATQPGRARLPRRPDSRRAALAQVEQRRSSVCRPFPANGPGICVGRILKAKKVLRIRADSCFACAGGWVQWAARRGFMTTGRRNSTFTGFRSRIVHIEPEQRSQFQGFGLTVRPPQGIAGGNGHAAPPPCLIEHKGELPRAVGTGFQLLMPGGRARCFCPC